MAANDMVPPIAVLPPLPEPAVSDEINHRVSNHLQMLAAMISVEARGISDQQSKAVLERTQQRLTAIGGVHRHLYLGGCDDIDLGSYLEDLGEQLARSCPVHRRIVVDAQSVPVSTSTATSIGILATELVTNACKHAYRADEPGGVLIVLRRMEDGSYYFAVEDRGSGNPDGPTGTGFGRHLIDSTVAKLGGLAVVENLRPGTRFKMTVRF